MIVRETDSEFILIQQHDHAILSEYLFTQFQTEVFINDKLLSSLAFAIKMHDVGWIPFDAAPIWDDKNNAPYSFISFPNETKTVLYKQGIDEVEEVDSYAALLCSKHYAHFLMKDTSVLAKEFLENESERQERLINSLKVDTDLLGFHFQLLQLFDNLSLFLCLNEPGTKKEDIHYFFKKGIKIPTDLQDKWGERFSLEWIDNERLTCTPYPFKDTLEIAIPYKKISKEDREKRGLITSYKEAEEETLLLSIKKPSI